MKRLIVELEINGYENMTDERFICYFNEVVMNLEDEDIQIVALIKPPDEHNSPR